MHELMQITKVETKLFFREPAAWVTSLALPTAILVIMGLIPSLREPSEKFGGLSFLQTFAPSLAVITLAVLGIQALPGKFASYREKGVLRRMSTTPVHPVNLLIAQLVINLSVAIVGTALMIVVGALVFDVAIPRNLGGFVLAFVLGMASLFALGTIVAAVATTTRMATAFTLPVFFVVMFLGGVYLPRFLLPEFLRDLGAYAPPGVQAMLDAWTGSAPALVPLAIMAVVAVVAGAAAAKLFRWE